MLVLATALLAGGRCGASIAVAPPTTMTKGQTMARAKRAGVRVRNGCRIGIVILNMVTELAR